MLVALRSGRRNAVGRAPLVGQVYRRGRLVGDASLVLGRGSGFHVLVGVGDRVRRRVRLTVAAPSGVDPLRPLVTSRFILFGAIRLERTGCRGLGLAVVRRLLGGVSFTPAVGSVVGHDSVRLRRRVLVVGRDPDHVVRDRLDLRLADRHGVAAGPLPAQRGPDRVHHTGRRFDEGAVALERDHGADHVAVRVLDRFVDVLPGNSCTHTPWSSGSRQSSGACTRGAVAGRRAAAPARRRYKAF